MLNLKGFKFPFQFNARGSLTMSEVNPNTSDLINESLQQIVLTYAGTRPRRRNFGTNQLVFSNLSYKFERVPYID